MLIRKYNLLIWRSVNNLCLGYVPSGVERDDLFQEGCIALYGAFNTYDTNRNVPFYSFAKLCIERSIIGYIRKFSSLSSKQFYSSLSLDAFVSDDVTLYYSDVLSDEKVISSLTKYDEDVGDLYLYSPIINKFEKNVLVLQIAGYSYSESANQLKCSVKKIDNTIQKIKRLLN